MQINYITELLYLKGVKVKDLIENEKSFEIYISTKAKEQTCPCCGNKTKYKA